MMRGIVKNGVDLEEVRDIIEEYSGESLTAEDVQQMIDDSATDGLSESEVKTLINNHVLTSTQIQASAVTSQINSLISEHSAVTSAPKFVAGSYTGTNSASPSLTFSFEPKLVILTRSADTRGQVIFVKGQARASHFPRWGTSTGHNLGLTVTFSNNKVSWAWPKNHDYGEDATAAACFNASGSAYYYVAFG